MAADKTIEQFLLPNQITNQVTSSESTSLEEAERNHIINALKKCNNKIYGAGGAAELLNILPTTLTSKTKKRILIRTIYKLHQNRAVSIQCILQ